MRRRADIVVGIVLLAILSIGGTLSWQAYRRRRALDQMMESMMGSSVGMVHGPNPLWYVLGTVLVAAAVGGVYLVVRRDFSTEPASMIPDESEPPSDDAQVNGGIDAETQSRTQVLDLLPNDERRILEPVIESPGITQIELRDRSDFSKSKVSQTVSELEKRGLLYRERQGRTYRVYPSDELRQAQ
ncbi:helix-turn-helix transcriptional regulator [Haloplanus aerogenes]|uniref:MarR family protein n=1 Tax=Haloplanus aerogenes TaxID=660522 RepID=A0A3M0D1X4_9EURY|nr:MarR family transcriptional regulator [Haloplanus aerogenes]AZH27063.1 MarR family transcriptional regulator [Haloplanus aerogenes]RMB13439.1 MarR family protein [Haloplanus aerogenes]